MKKNGFKENLFWSLLLIFFLMSGSKPVAKVDLCRGGRRRIH